MKSEKELAEYLHTKYCGYNHTEECAWDYEIGGECISKWEKFAHKKWLKKAKDLIKWLEEK
jgi:hypothetical protein